MSVDHKEKEYFNRLTRRAEAHGLHLEQVADQDGVNETDAQYVLKNIQTGAVEHGAGKETDKGHGVGLREVEAYLNGISAP